MLSWGIGAGATAALSRIQPPPPERPHSVPSGWKRHRRAMPDGIVCDCEFTGETQRKPEAKDLGAQRIQRPQRKTITGQRRSTRSIGSDRAKKLKQREDEKPEATHVVAVFGPLCVFYTSVG